MTTTQPASRRLFAHKKPAALREECSGQEDGWRFKEIIAHSFSFVNLPEVSAPAFLLHRNPCAAGS